MTHSGKMVDEKQEQEGIWCVVANVGERQVFGEDHQLQLGTRHFSPNTKVYCFPPQWHGFENIKVLGRHRGSSRLVTMVMPAKRLTNWRVRYTCHPYVMQQMKPGWDKDFADEMVASILFLEAAEEARQDTLENVEPDRALIFAARLRLPEEVQRALSRGADINTLQYGWTPLTLAVTFNDPETVKLLISNGADMQKPNEAGETPLHLAKQYGNNLIATLLTRVALTRAGISPPI